MYPHKFDRYRLMGYIMRQLRKSQGLSQQGLAEQIMSRQSLPGGRKPTPRSTLQRRISHIENFEHLEETAFEAQRPVAREMFLDTASEGLALTPLEIETLLWLIEGDEFQPLAVAELAVHPAIGGHDTFRCEEQEWRSHSLALLERAVRLARQREHAAAGAGSGAGTIAGQVRMLTGWEEAHQVRFRDELLAIESKPGQRLLISKYPSLLAYPGDAFVHIDLDEWLMSPSGLEQIKGITDRRRHVFRSNLRQFGERHIHSRESLKRYVAEGFSHPLSAPERRRHIQNLIQLLRDNPLFEVALATVEPEMEFVIKSGQVASLRGTARDIRRRESVICGPLYIFWDNITTVYSFMVDFEHAWEKIPADQRQKN